MNRPERSHRRELGLLSSVLSGQYLEGLSTFRSMESPSAEDFRWAGVCAFNLQDLALAETLARSACVHGCAAAATELATIHRQRGEYLLAEQVLMQCEVGTLSPFDQALWYRERGSHAFALGRIVEAADSLQSAWTAAHTSAETAQLLPGIGQALALLHSLQGQDRRAQVIVDQVLPTANPARAVYLRSARGLARTYLGLFSEAAEDLSRALNDCEAIPVARPVVTYNCAVLARARGDSSGADELFGKVAQLAAEACEPETECYAHLGLAAVMLAAGDLSGAQARLARAQHLVVSERVRGMVLMRQTALLTATSRPGASEALGEALGIFRSLGLHRETGWALLFRADLALGAGTPEVALMHLEEAVNLRYALASPFLSYELRTMPRLRAFLETLPTSHYCAVLARDIQDPHSQNPPQVFVRTLGQAGISVGGRRARLDLARSVEVLIFLMLYPCSSLATVLSQVFPDEAPRKARNYFHQVRYELARAVPGLHISFDSDKLYSADWKEVRCSVDFFELQAALNMTSFENLESVLNRYAGVLLPRSEADWVVELRQKLNSDVVYFGARTLEAAEDTVSEATFFTLAEGMIGLDPLNESLIEGIVHSAVRRYGRASARFLLERSLDRFGLHIGKSPETLGRLHHSLCKVS